MLHRPVASFAISSDYSFMRSRGLTKTAKNRLRLVSVHESHHGWTISLIISYGASLMTRRTRAQLLCWSILIGLAPGDLSEREYSLLLRPTRQLPSSLVWYDLLDDSALSRPGPAP